MQAANRGQEKQKKPDETKKDSFDQARDRRNCSFAGFFSSLLGRQSRPIFLVGMALKL